VWARPLQAPSGSGWFPGLVVAGPADSPGPMTLPRPLTLANLRRLPPALLPPLTRSLRSPQPLDPSQWPPPGLLLVEFFGPHDFSWALLRAAEPLDLRTPEPGHYPNLLTRLTASSGPVDPRLSVGNLPLALRPPATSAARLGPREALEEAKAALLTWTRRRRSLTYFPQPLDPCLAALDPKTLPPGLRGGDVSRA